MTEESEGNTEAAILAKLSWYFLSHQHAFAECHLVGHRKKARTKSNIISAKLAFKVQLILQ